MGSKFREFALWVLDICSVCALIACFLSLRDIQHTLSLKFLLHPAQDPLGQPCMVGRFRELPGWQEPEEVLKEINAELHAKTPQPH